MRGYGEDLAFIHDAGYSTPPAGLMRLLPRRGRVVDLGCGSGVWAAQLCKTGHEVIGIDQSAPMIRLARRRAARARFIRASVFSVAIPECDTVTALGEVFNYQFARGNLGRLFGRVHAALGPGGVFLFDLAGPGRATGSHHRVGDDWACFAHSREVGRTLIREITSFRRVGKVWRQSDETHRLRLYAPSEVMTLLERAGFRARRLPKQRPGLHVYLARK